MQFLQSVQYVTKSTTCTKRMKQIATFLWTYLFKLFHTKITNPHNPSQLGGLPLQFHGFHKVLSRRQRTASEFICCTP